MDLHLLDLYHDGHHRSYLEMIASSWADLEPSGTLYVHVPSSFVAAHPDFPGGAPRVALRPLGSVDDAPSGGLVTIARAHRRALREVSGTATGPVLLMYFDDAQYAAAMHPRSGPPLAGIYFRSPFDVPSSTVRTLRKRAVLRSALRSVAVQRLFCLDPRDVDPVDAVARRRVGVVLPDAVEPPEDLPAAPDARRDLEIEPGVHVFLLFGALNRRKGLDVLASAASLMDPSALDRAVFVVAGSTRPSDREAVDEALDRLRRRARVVRLDAFVPDDRMHALFAAADTVVMPYTSDHSGSSGVVIRAAASDTPVVGPEGGMVGDAIRQHHLGIGVDTTSPRALAAGLASVIGEPTRGFEPTAARSFAARHTSERFAGTIIGELQSVSG